MCAEPALRRNASRSRTLIILPALIFALARSATAGVLIPAAGALALVAAGAVALEIWNASTGPLDTDPTSIENAISQVKQMQRTGASNSQVASYLSGVVDRRMIAPDMITPGEGLITALDPWNKRELIERHSRYRNPSGPQVRRIGASPDVERARWAWANGVGNCEEAASATFSILNRAGIPVRYVRSSASGGHAFSVIGLADGANINDPSSWGPDAFVVDGWTGSALSAEQARNSPWHGRDQRQAYEDWVPARLTDVTDEEHKPEVDRRFNEMAGKGVLSLIVVNPAGRPVGGARVQVATDKGTFTAVTTAGGGTYVDLPAGGVTISIDPPENAGLSSTGATATIQERLFTQLTVKLPERPAPIPPAQTATILSGSGTLTLGKGTIPISSFTIDVAKGTFRGTGSVTESIKPRPARKGEWDILGTRKGGTTTTAVTFDGRYEGDGNTGALEGTAVVKFNDSSGLGINFTEPATFRGKLENGTVTGKCIFKKGVTEMNVQVK